MSANTAIVSDPALPRAVPGEHVEFRARIDSISRQSAVYFAGTILTAAAGYFFKLYLARTLGAEALGIYALGMSVVAIVSLFGAVGLPAAAARFIAEYSSQGQFLRLGGFLRASVSALLLISVAIGVGFVVGVPWIAVHVYHSPVLARFSGAFALITVLGVFTAFLGQAMAGYRDVAQRTVITHFVGTPANMLFAVLLISLGFGLGGYLAAQVLSAVLVLVLLASAVWRRTPMQARSGTWAPLGKTVIAFSGAALSLSVVEIALGQADKIVLGCYLPAKDIGVYAVAMALVGFVPVALQSVNQIFSPTISELHSVGDIGMLQRLYSVLTKWVLVATLPLATTMVVLSHPFMAIFGSTFTNGAAVLVIGASAQVINCAVGSVGYLLLMSGNQFQLVKIQIFSAALTIILSVVLVPRLGIAGAAIAIATSIIVTNLWSLYAVSQRLRIFPYDRTYFKLLPPWALCAGFLLLLLRLASLHSNWRLALVGLTGSYLLFVPAFLLFGLDGDDRRFAASLAARLGLNAKNMEWMPHE